MISKRLVLLGVGLLLAVGTAGAQTKYALRTDARGTWIKGFYPLYEALAQRDVEQVRRLVPAGEAINAYGEAGATPLSWLMTNFDNDPEDLRLLRYLLERGADPNVPDAPLPDGTAQRAGVHLYAGRNASAEATGLLISHGMTFETPVGHDALVEAAAAGNLAFLRTASERGALTLSHVAELPMLAAATLQGQYLTVGFLLGHGADPNVGALEGLWPLHWAVIRNQPGIARLLLENGADPGRRTDYPANPALDKRTALELVDVLREQEGVGPDDRYLLDLRAMLEAAAEAGTVE